MNIRVDTVRNAGKTEMSVNTLIVMLTLENKNAIASRELWRPVSDKIKSKGLRKLFYIDFHKIVYRPNDYANYNNQEYKHMQDEYKYNLENVVVITGISRRTLKNWLPNYKGLPSNRYGFPIGKQSEKHKHRRYCLNDLLVISTMRAITAHTSAQLTDVYKLAKQAVRTKGTKLFLYVRDGKWYMSAATPHTSSYTCLNIQKIKENIKRNIENEYT